MEQRAHGLGVWQEPLVPLRVPKLFNLRSDPFERGDEDASVFYDKWMADRAFLLVPAQAIVGEFLKTFKEFPPRQKPASFSIDQALEKARAAGEHLAARLAEDPSSRGSAPQGLGKAGVQGSTSWAAPGEVPGAATRFRESEGPLPARAGFRVVATLPASPPYFAHKSEDTGTPRELLHGDTGPWPKAVVPDA